MQTIVRKEQIWLAVGSLMIIAAVALAAGLVYTQVVMVPFILAVFLTTVVSPVVDFIVVRWKIPQSIAIVLALLLVIGFLCLLVLFLTVAVNTILNTADKYSNDFSDMANKTFEQLKKWDIDIDYNSLVSDVKQKLPALVGVLAGTGTALVANVVLITFFVLFLLAGRDSHRVRLGIQVDIENSVRRYIVIKFIISAVTGLLVWWILYLLGLQMAFVFGLLTFLLNFIPSIGSVIATFLPLPLAVAQFPHDIWLIIAVVAIPGTLQLVIGNVLEPKLMGRSLELHPVSVLLSLAFWGLLWGYMGMILAVPITAVIRIILIRYETTRAMGNLLGGKLPGGDDAMLTLKTGK